MMILLYQLIRMLWKFCSIDISPNKADPLNICMKGEESLNLTKTLMT